MTSRLTRTPAFLVAGILCLAAAPLRAVILPNGYVAITGQASAQAEGGVWDTDEYFLRTGLASASSVGPGVPASSADAASEASLANNGTVKSSAQATGNHARSGSSADISYSIRVLGEDRPEGVPYTVSVLGWADGTGNSTWNYGERYAEATFEMGGLLRADGGFDQIKVQGISGYGGAEGYVPIKWTRTLMLPTNRDVTIALSVVSWALSGFTSDCERARVSCDQSASAYLDPVFRIDPAFASRYTLAAAFELDLGDTSPPAGAVPEPASWALMIAGFGAIGAAMRRRRPVALPA